VVWKSIKIAAPQSARVEMKEPGIGADLFNAYPELREKIVTQLFRDRVILFQDLIQIDLNTTVKSS
jgi:hypothetical protein